MSGETNENAVFKFGYPEPHPTIFKDTNKIQTACIFRQKNGQQGHIPPFLDIRHATPKKNAGPTDHACPALRIYPIAEVPLFHSYFINSFTGTNYIQSGSDRNTEFIAVFFCYKLSANIVDSHLQRFYGRNNHFAVTATNTDARQFYAAAPPVRLQQQ